MFAPLSVKISLTRHEAVPAVAPQVAAEVEPGLHPLHREVEPERDGVILVIDAQHVRDLKTWEIKNNISFIF